MFEFLHYLQPAVIKDISSIQREPVGIHRSRLVGLILVVRPL